MVSDDDLAARCELRIDLERACRGLTARQRQALALWLQGYTQREIGEMMGIRRWTVCGLLRRAFRRLNTTFCRDFGLYLVGD